MKSISILILSFSISHIASAAVDFSVVGPCSSQPILETKVVTTQLYKNIGQLSVSTIEKFNMPLIGTENKIESINNTPVGEAALEILSRNEMRAYGWCFYVNGEQPEVYPNEIKVTPLVRTVKWIFGYAHYLDGEWLSMCEPSWKIKPEFLCSKK